MNERLAAYEYPREIEFLDELPMTTTGKIIRRKLRQREMTSKGRATRLRRAHPDHQAAAPAGARSTA